MVSMYLPTIDRPLWPCFVLLAVFIPISIWHEIHWRRTVRDYAGKRREVGATGEWPTGDVRFALSIQPGLLLFATVLLALMVWLGATALFTWPKKPLLFREPLNYFDRPYLAAMLVAGTAAVVGALALCVDLWRSPWRGVARQIRRAVHARPRARDERMAAALLVDPGVAEGRPLAAQAAAVPPPGAPPTDAPPEPPGYAPRKPPD
ncbi:MAG: hypothetical protein HGB10_08500 [Coriobacteriia bacterium]|nr:hypothetical protein [Coriobacteriia bacterium]